MGLMSKTILAALLSLLCGCASTRRRETTRLVYAVDARASGCPTTGQLKHAVQKRLGYAPWADDAARRVELHVAEEAAGLGARIRLQSPGRPAARERRLSGTTEECRDLVGAAALAISLAIDPVAVRRLEQEQRRPRRRRLQVGAGGHVSVGLVPGVSGGGHVELGLRWPRLSLGVAARLDAPREQEAEGVGVSVLFVGGSLLGCGHHRTLFGCAVLSAGASRGVGQALRDARAAWLPHLGLGPRLGVELFATRRIAVRIFSELTVPIIGARFADDADTIELWSTPSVTGMFGLAISRFFL
jgi:hypothetical protein